MGKYKSGALGGWLLMIVVITVVEDEVDIVELDDVVSDEPVEPLMTVAPYVVEEGDIVVAGNIPAPDPDAGTTVDVAAGKSVAGAIVGGIVV